MLMGSIFAGSIDTAYRGPVKDHPSVSFGRQQPLKSSMARFDRVQEQSERVQEDGVKEDGVKEDGVKEQIEVALTLDGFARESIEEEAARLGVSVEELASFAILYYLADLDSGRIARQVSRSPYPDMATR
jgi:hypothetical protein